MDEDFHPGKGWRLKEADEYVTLKHILIEWSPDAKIRRIWVEDAVEELTEEDLHTRRLKACVDAWPEAYSGDYNPACCRFPKSCSPHGYIEAVEAGNLTDKDLEPKRK